MMYIYIIELDIQRTGWALKPAWEADLQAKVVRNIAVCMSYIYDEAPPRNFSHQWCEFSPAERLCATHHCTSPAPTVLLFSLRPGSLLSVPHILERQAAPISPGMPPHLPFPEDRVLPGLSWSPSLLKRSLSFV